jgi:hypothetical protein
MRHSLMFPLAIVMVAAPLAAVPVPPSQPFKVMHGVYKAMENGSEAPNIPLTPRLRALMALEQKETPEGELGRIDFDWLVNGQDSKITDSKVTVRTVDYAPSRMIVVVRFKNFGKQMENHFFWEKDAKGKWALDDVRSIEPDGPGFTLSLVLKYGYDGPEEPIGAAKDE